LLFYSILEQASGLGKEQLPEIAGVVIDAIGWEGLQAYIDPNRTAKLFPEKDVFSSTPESASENSLL
jgi:hypothetical protein